MADGAQYVALSPMSGRMTPSAPARRRAQLPFAPARDVARPRARLRRVNRRRRRQHDRDLDARSGRRCDHIRNHFLRRGDDRELDGRLDRCERREARAPEDGAMARIHRVQRSLVAADQHVLEHGAAEGRRSLGCADERDRGGFQQRTKVVLQCS